MFYIYLDYRTIFYYTFSNNIDEENFKSKQSLFRSFKQITHWVDEKKLTILLKRMVELGMINDSIIFFSEHS